MNDLQGPSMCYLIKAKIANLRDSKPFQNCYMELDPSWQQRKVEFPNRKILIEPLEYLWTVSVLY